MINNNYSIEILVQDILKRKYPFEDGGDSLDYSLFSDWDIKLENPFIYLNEMSKSNDYMALHIASYVIENMAIEFLQNNRKEVMSIIKRLISNNNFQRLEFHLLREIILLIKDNEDFIYYLKILNETSGVLQNQAIFLLKNLEIEKIVKFNDISKESFFESFIICKKSNLAIHKNILMSKSDLYKKIYVTGLYRNGYKKNEIFSIADEYENIDLMDYIYVYLD